MDHDVELYIPDSILDDYERMAQMRMKWQDDRRLVPVHANVLLGLLRVYREARKEQLSRVRQQVAVIPLGNRDA